MILTNYADFIIGLQYGDEGKGKIASSISEQMSYSYTARYNGGPNAGHTVVVGDKTLKLHQLPSSVAHKKRGYIGPGSLIDFTKLEKEANVFKEIMGFCPFTYLTISPKAIVISDEHINKDKKYHAGEQGSTSSGIAPAYADFYNRTAELAESYSWPDENGRECIGDLKETESLLFEGAQGFWLNPYQGTYPYTTSSSCSPGTALSNFGISHDSLSNVVGVAKCYETRSGKDPSFRLLMSSDGSFHPPKQNFELEYKQIQKLGSEVGVTTGRKRAVRFLDLTRLIYAIKATGTNILVLQKWDILEVASWDYANVFCFYKNARLVSSRSLQEMIEKIKVELYAACQGLDEIIISSSPVVEDIDWNDFL